MEVAYYLWSLIFVSLQHPVWKWSWGIGFGFNDQNQCICINIYIAIHVNLLHLKRYRNKKFRYQLYAYLSQYFTAALFYWIFGLILILRWWDLNLVLIFIFLKTSINRINLILLICYLNIERPKRSRETHPNQITNPTRFDHKIQKASSQYHNCQL